MSSRAVKSPRLLKKPQLEKTVNILKDELNRLHQELYQTRNELKLEKTKSVDFSLALDKAEKEIQLVQEQHDVEISKISGKLLSLEGSFMKEQKEIYELIDSRDTTIVDLQEEVKKREKLIEKQSKELAEMKFHFEKELKARDKRIASQWRELEGFKHANTKFIGAISQLKTSSLSTRSASSSSIREAKANGVPKRRSLSPNPRRRKFCESSEWKEELSAFF